MAINLELEISKNFVITNESNSDDNRLIYSFNVFQARVHFV